MCKKCLAKGWQGFSFPAHTLSRRALLGAGMATATVIALGGINLSQASALTVPTIYSDSQWGALPPKSPVVMLSNRANKILVHHTDTPNTTDYSQSEAFALAREIQQMHFNNGWIDTGQHFTVSRGGYILEGRHRSLEALQNGHEMVEGAHCPGENDQAIGIEDEGTYDTVMPTTALLNSLAELCIYVCRQYGLNASNIFGHRDFYFTDCPGVMFYGYLPTLRQKVAAGLGQTLPPRNWPVYENGLQGESVKSVQYLLAAQGYSISVDGIFGSGTQSTVQSFQANHGISATGIVDQTTWETLIIQVQNGSSGNAVSAVQDQLNSKGYSVSVDGQFGSLTQSTVEQFQTHYGLTADGVVGPFTWCALVGGSSVE